MANPTLARSAPVKSAARTLAVLEELAGSGPSSLHELVERMRLPKSSLHALLQTMVARGWLETDQSGTIYGLGIRSLLIGSAYLDSDLAVSHTRSILDELASSTGETVHLGRLEGADVVYLAKRESIHPLRMFSAVGRRLPAHATALGRAILAEMPDQQLEQFLPRTIRPLTPHTTISRSELIRAIKTVRRTGYATEQQESCPGVSCFAVTLPLSTPSKEAISIAVPLTRLDKPLRDRIINELKRVRSELHVCR